jgi:hypothetical protein
VLPQDAEQNPLQPIGQNLGLQSSEHESGHSALGNDVAHHLSVGQDILVRLFVDLDDPNTVAAGITDRGGAKAENGTSTQLHQLRILLWNILREVVVGEEPGVVPHEGCRRSRNGSIVERQGSTDLDFIHDAAKLSRHLHRRLDRVYGHEKDAPHGSCSRGGHSFDGGGHVLGGLVRVQQREHARVGSRVSESGEGALDQGGGDAAVEAQDASVGVESAESDGERRSISVLVVDLCVIVVCDCDCRSE